MKRLFAVVLILCFVLAGCGNGNTNTEKTTFVVGMECDYAPFNWTTLEQGEHGVAISGGGYADGYDVVIAQEIADALGLELVIKKIAWEGLQPALQSNEIDAIIAGMTADETREKNGDFTTPYYDSEMVMIVRKDDALAQATTLVDFSGKTVVGQISTNYDTIIEQIPGVNHHTPLKTYPLMIYALQSKEVDGITAELPVALGAVQANSDLAIVHFEEGYGFDIDTTVSICLKEGSRDGEFFKQVQAALDAIDADTRLTYMLEATNRQPANN
ncbi:MAG: transporter substrate-binding domain-containing protein [Erysipelotrichaceae bacterium]|nr:transporter substrate-binding domain-containing protein [Erysipelotrichaceae bacterium]